MIKKCKICRIKYKYCDCKWMNTQTLKIIEQNATNAYAVTKIIKKSLMKR